MYMKVVKDGEDYVGNVKIVAKETVSLGRTTARFEVEFKEIAVDNLTPVEQFFDGIEKKLGELPKDYLFFPRDNPESKVITIRGYLMREHEVADALGMEYIEARMPNLAKAYNEQMKRVEAAKAKTEG